MKWYERCFFKSFGWYEGLGQLFIAMEYPEIGDLFTYLYHKPSLPEDEAKEIAYQILDGLNMMHENGFSHRNLKPAAGSLISVEMRSFTKQMTRIYSSSHTLQLSGGSSWQTLVSPTAYKRAMRNRRYRVPHDSLLLNFGM